MKVCTLLMVGIGISLALAGCKSAPPAPKSASAGYSKEGEFGNCEYKNGFRGDDQYAILLKCKPEEQKTRFSMGCYSIGAWAIIVNVPPSYAPRGNTKIEYQFDDNLPVTETWDGIPNTGFAALKTKSPNKAFLDNMKTAKKLKLTVFGQAVHVDLDGALEGVQKFETNCEKLAGYTKSKLDQTSPVPDQVKRYLEWANTGLPRAKYRTTVERVYLKNKNLILQVSVDATEVETGKKEEAMKNSFTAAIREIAKLCKNPHYNSLREKGYRFTVEFSAVNSRGEDELHFKPIEHTDCRQLRQL